MSALPYQPAPTIAQRKALHTDHAQRYARQYAANQPDYPEVAAAGVACCAEVADEDTELTWPSLILAMAAGLILWAFIGWACAPFAAPFIASLQRIAP